MADTPYDDAIALLAGSRKAIASSRERLESHAAARRQDGVFFGSAGDRVAQSRALLARPVYTGWPQAAEPVRKKRAQAKK